MAKINEIDITSLLFQEGSAPSTPASTKWRAYFKTDGLYVIDDAGTETGPLAASGGSSIAESAKASRQSTTQSISNASVTLMIFDTEVWDDNGLIDLGTDADAIKIITAGKYVVTGSMVFATDTSGNRAMNLLVNSSSVATMSGDASAGGGNSNGQMTVTAILDLSVNDLVQLNVYQGSGGSLNLLADARNSLSVARIA